MKISIKSNTKLSIHVLENINIFPFKNLVVKFIFVSFFTANYLMLLNTLHQNQSNF